MPCRQRSACVRNRLPVVVSLLAAYGYLVPTTISLYPATYLDLICVSPRTCPIRQENRRRERGVPGNRQTPALHNWPARPPVS
ncbi:hypothetical protein CDEST_08224 [Colletotrichum destructivum]|uniref:Secreted protein n=1 Tax=Colletotrichum destructivum TaxID=34406 RepID=A0AAX4IIR2_9PEZI|nr:hypothetical protein CDEST_08224 [Colletotrichum destructivum]